MRCLTVTFQFNGLAFNPAGQLVAIDTNNKRLVEFTGGIAGTSPSAVQVTSVPLSASPLTMAFQAGSSDPWLLVPGCLPGLASFGLCVAATPGYNPIQQVSASTGAVLASINTSAVAALDDYLFSSVQFDSAGNAYLAGLYPGVSTGALYNPFTDFAQYTFGFGAFVGVPASNEFPQAISLIKLSPSGSLVYVVNVTLPQFSPFYKLAVSAAGTDLYASTSDAVYHFSATTGALLGSVPLNGSSEVVAVSPASGDVIALTSDFAVLNLYASNLTVRDSFLTSEVTLTPARVAASPVSGVVYVLDEFDGDVTAFASNGTDLGLFATSGAAELSLSLACDGQGNVYVEVVSNATAPYGVGGLGTVQKLSANGTLLQTFDDPLFPLYLLQNSPLAINPNNGQVAAVNFGPGFDTCNLTIFAASGFVVGRLALPDSFCFEDVLSTVAFTSTNELVYIEYAAGLDNAGRVVLASSTTGTILSSFNYSSAWDPTWLAVSPDDRLFVVDSMSNQVLEFNLLGELLSIPVPTSLNLIPYSVAYSSHDNLLYVVDRKASSVLAFSAAASSSSVLGGHTSVE